MAQEEDGVEKQRKRLLYQSRHRGTKESDLFLGAFADSYLPNFSPTDLRNTNPSSPRMTTRCSIGSTAASSRRAMAL